LALLLQSINVIPVSEKSSKTPKPVAFFFSMLDTALVGATFLKLNVKLAVDDDSP
jgi:hypothetical protein